MITRLKSIFKSLRRCTRMIHQMSRQTSPFKRQFNTLSMNSKLKKKQPPKTRKTAQMKILRFLKLILQ